MTIEHETETKDIEVLEMTATQARRRFRRLMVLARQNTVVRITRLGKPVVYMVPVRLYETWMTALPSDADREPGQDVEEPPSQS